MYLSLYKQQGGKRGIQITIVVPNLVHVTVGSSFMEELTAFEKHSLPVCSSQFVGNEIQQHCKMPLLCRQDTVQAKVT